MFATILQAAGIGVIALGAGLIYPPLGIILLGAGVLLFGLALERGN